MLREKANSGAFIPVFGLSRCQDAPVPVSTSPEKVMRYSNNPPPDSHPQPPQQAYVGITSSSPPPTVQTWPNGSYASIIRQA